MSDSALSEGDWQIRYFVYTFFVDHARPPSVAVTAAQFGISEAEARAAYHRLHAAHTLFLAPGTDSVRMANPLSAVPTDYRVHIQGKTLWANCAWDSLGIPAMLHADATIEATVRPSGEHVTYAVDQGQLRAPGGVIHFPLPFARWYDDLVYT